MVSEGRGRVVQNTDRFEKRRGHCHEFLKVLTSTLAIPQVWPRPNGVASICGERSFDELVVRLT